MKNTSKETKQLRRKLAKFMDGLILFENRWLEAIDRTFWRTFFWTLFTLLSKYITVGLVQEIEKVLNWIKDEDWVSFDNYVSDLLNNKVDIPFIDEESEKIYFITAIQFLHSTLVLVRNKVNAISEKAEADDPILSDE